MAEIFIDNKILAAKAQKKKEEMLEKQVKVLQEKLDETIKAQIENNSINTDVEENINNIENSDIIEDNNEVSTEPTDEAINEVAEVASDVEKEKVDIEVKVSPKKVSKIETKIIDGKKYIMIPMDENEHANVNGVEKMLY